MTKDDFLNSAGIIAGSPVYFGAMAWNLKRVFDEYVCIRKKMESNVGAQLSPRPEMHQVEKRLQ